MRSLLAACATLLIAGLGFGAKPAAAFVGEYRFSDRAEGASGSADRRQATRTRANRQRTVRQNRPARTSQRATRRAPASLSGGGFRSTGIASFYWQPQRVASGGWFNPNAMTAAHRTLPFGTRVLVTNLSNGRSVTVRINDRGPFIAGRIIDLSRAAASAVGMTGAGLARVNIAVLGR
jgi:rare lipoprotein A